jgi:hypothetical protein
MSEKITKEQIEKLKKEREKAMKPNHIIKK